MKIFNYL